MSFELQRETIFVNMRLTSVGRQLASLGRLRFRKAIFSDDEVDYAYDTPFNSIEDCMITSPSDVPPKVLSRNFDGTPAIQLNGVNARRGVENMETHRFDQPFFFSAGTNNILDVSKCIAVGSSLTSAMSGSKTLAVDDITSIDVNYSATTYERCVGNLIMIRHHAPTSSALNHFGQQPFVTLWYRVNSWDSGTNFTLDRNLPNFASGSGNILWFVYPWSGYTDAMPNTATTNSSSLFVFSAEYTGPMIDTKLNGPYGYKVYSNDGLPGIDTGMYFNSDHWDFYVAGDLKYSSLPQDVEYPSQATSWSGVSGADPTPTFAGYSNDNNIWNLNIIRNINEIGSTGATTGYTTYGSIEYNGVKRAFNFSPDQRAIGIIHQSDNMNDGDGRLQPSATTIHMPTLLWHRKFEFTSGKATKGGHSFSDKYGLMKYDPVSKLNYTTLLDQLNENGEEVGRVYHDIRTIVITQQDLLNAMSYKSNRNWTVPKLNVSLRQPTSSSTTGLCKSDKVYLVTYAFLANATYSSASTFSYRQAMYCGEIAKIEGMAGGPYTLNATLENNYFPYLRGANNITSFSGTGWNMNNFNILVKEMDKNDFSGTSKAPSGYWKKLTTGGEYSNQHGEVTISASGITTYQFSINQSDYNSGSNYLLDPINGDPFDRTFSGLSYGDESFFHGSVEYDLIEDPEKMSFNLKMLPHEFNSTKNSTFTDRNECTYVTGIYIFDDLDRVVAVAKPSYPIKKDHSRYVEFKLDLIY